MTVVLFALTLIVCNLIGPNGFGLVIALTGATCGSLMGLILPGLCYVCMAY